MLLMDTGLKACWSWIPILACVFHPPTLGHQHTSKLSSRTVRESGDAARTRCKEANPGSSHQQKQARAGAIARRDELPKLD